MTYNEQLNQEIENHFRIAHQLFVLINENVQSIAENVVSMMKDDEKHLDSTKMGCYIAWVERLTTLLPEKEILRLIENLEK